MERLFEIYYKHWKLEISLHRKHKLPLFRALKLGMQWKKNLINQFITNTKQANDFCNYQDNSIFALLCKTYLLNWIWDHQNYLQYTG